MLANTGFNLHRPTQVRELLERRQQRAVALHPLGARRGEQRRGQPRVPHGGPAGCSLRHVLGI